MAKRSKKCPVSVEKHGKSYSVVTPLDPYPLFISNSKAKAAGAVKALCTGNFKAFEKITRGISEFSGRKTKKAKRSRGLGCGCGL